MYPVSTTYRSILEEGNNSHWWYGSITLKDNTVIPFDNSHVADGSGTLIKKCSESSEIGIGTAYSSEFSVQFKNHLNISRYKLFDGVIGLYARIRHKASIETWEDAGNFTWEQLAGATWGVLADFNIDYVFPMGQFIIKEVMQSAGNVSIRAYDFMVLFDKDLPGALPTGKKIPYDWLKAACTACGVQLGITRAEILKMPNGNRLMELSNASEQMSTWRDVVAEAAETLGGNAMMTRDGKLTVRRYSKYSVDGVASGFRYSSDFSDYQSYYTGIYLNYKDGGVQDYQTNAASAAQDTGLSFDLGYNAFLQISDEDTRHRAMKEIIDAHKDLAYIPFKVSMPFNPAYDLMDVLEFYENQAADDDIAPITAITFRIGGKMDISCGGENPALQEAKTKETRAVENMSSGGGNGDFWIVIDNAPGDNSLTIPADTATKIGEALFYAKEELSTFEISYTATYTLLKTTLVETEVFVDDESIYKTQENQWPGENRLTVTTGYELRGTGSHKVEIYLTVTESTLDVGGGGILMELNVSENNEYVAQDYGVYGFRKMTVFVDGGGNGYYGGAKDVSSQIERISVGSAYSDLEDQSYGTETGYSLPPTYDVSQGFIEYINPNRSALSFYLANWPYRMTDKFELVYKMISNPAQMGLWPTLIGTSAATNAKMYAQFNFYGSRTVMNLAYNGNWAGDGNMSYESPFDYENYYRLVGEAGTFTLYKGPTLDSINTQCFQKVFTDGSGPSGFCVTLLPTGNTEKLDMNIYGLKVWDEDGNLIHHYRPIEDGLCDTVTNYVFMATTTGHINGPAVN